jgi:choline transporter-like protein 2/4/5
MLMVRNGVDMLQRYIADLGRAWPVLVVCGGIAPLVLSIAYLILVRYFVGVLTWLTIILLNILTLLVTLFFYIKGTFCSSCCCSLSVSVFAMYYLCSEII